MYKYEDIVSIKVANYIDSFKHNYQEDNCDIYFMESDGASLFFEECSKLFMHFGNVDEKAILKDAQNLALTSSKANIPYIILHNILECFENAILRDILQEGHSTSVAYHFLKQVTIASDTVSKYYLSGKIEKFRDNNDRRIKTIKELIDTKTIHFFEGHLIWLDTLAHAIIHLDTNILPELNPKECFLGKWLDEEGKEVIVDHQNWQNLDMLHYHLHHIAKRVEILMRSTPIDYHYLLLLLEKADHLSLSIGIDLTLINNIEYIKYSSKDPLTGVLNRQLLNKIFTTQFKLSKSLDTGFALIMSDMDDFKQINDQYGHVFGDIVLKEFANILEDSTRKSDFVIRFGGEEFILILPVTTLSEAKVIAEKICSIFARKPIDQDGKPRYFSASFGVSYIHPEIGELLSQRHITELINEVDQKMLLAKQLGKNRVVT